MNPKQAELTLIRCIADAITHVSELKARRQHNTISPIEAVGMFATALRREVTTALSRQDIPLLKIFCQKIKEAWDDVGKPKPHTYCNPWNFEIPMEGGVWKMNSLHADHVCRTASAQASYSSDAETTIEINRSLVELESSLRNMRAGVTVAASINAQAEDVLYSLCQVAERLTA